MNCQKCGAAVESADKFCPVCGTEQKITEVSETKSFCQNCGQVIEEGEMFCPVCGTKTTEGSQPEYKQNQYYSRPPKKSNNNTLAIILIIIATIIAIALIITSIVVISKRNARNNAVLPSQNSVEGVPENHPAPVFDWVATSSTRGYDVDSASGDVIYYYPEYAIDQDMRTAWSPDRKYGFQPTLTLNAHSPQYVSGIRMTNGYCKSENTYTKNRRITRVLIEYNGGSKTAAFDINNYRQMITVPFDTLVNTDYISVTVLDTHYGEWNDIAISEITAY